MNHCCQIVFRQAFEEIVFLLQEKNINRERLIEIIEYAISELKKTEKI